MPMYRAVVGGGGESEMVEMTPEEEAAVIATRAAAAVAFTVFSEDVRISGRVRTTDATPTEAYRLALLPLTGYTGQVAVIGVDTGNGAVRVIRASFAAKRLNGGALAVGAPVVLASHADTGTTTWQIAASVVGDDAVVTVTGAAGRVVDWSVSGTMTTFTPAGRASA